MKSVPINHDHASIGGKPFPLPTYVFKRPAFAGYRDILRATTIELFKRTDGTPDEVPENIRITGQYRL